MSQTTWANRAVKKRCTGCEMMFVQLPSQHRTQCVDCDPPDTEDGVTIGRDSSIRPASESAYHGTGYRD